MTKYESGARVERKVRKILEDQGYYVVRSAGSKGAVDLVAWSDQDIRLIQVKATSNKKYTLNKTESQALQQVPRPKNARVQLYVWLMGKGVYKIHEY